jgi:hypothetical protein
MHLRRVPGTSFIRVELPNKNPQASEDVGEEYEAYRDEYKSFSSTRNAQLLLQVAVQLVFVLH